MKTSKPGLLRRHVHKLTMAGPRFGGSAARYRAEKYIINELRRQGWNITLQRFDTRPIVSLNDDSTRAHPFPLHFFRRLPGRNIIATPRRGQPGPRTVLSAHYDTVTGSVGADDNTSGVASVLEAARLLRGTELPISLVFFDREETGMQGSAAWSRKHGQSAATVINLEMVGYFNDAPRSNPVPWIARTTFPVAADQLAERGYRRDSLLVVHDQRSTRVAETFEIAAEAAGMATVDVADPRPAGRARHLIAPLMPATALLERSDHTKLWDRGIPAITVTSGTPNGTPHYHRRTDVSHTLDYGRLAGVADAAVAAAVMLAGTN